MILPKSVHFQSSQVTPDLAEQIMVMKESQDDTKLLLKAQDRQGGWGISQTQEKEMTPYSSYPYRFCLPCVYSTPFWMPVFVSPLPLYDCMTFFLLTWLSWRLKPKSMLVPATRSWKANPRSQLAP